MRVLGIESSCDETAVAVYDEARGLLSHRLHSQVAMHQAYGGVVPELASRDHVRRLLPLVREALAEAESDRASIDGIAYTAGPGLIGALLVGEGFATALGVGVGQARAGNSPLGGPSPGAPARAQTARLPVPRAAGLRRPYPARGCRGAWAATGFWARPWTMPPGRPSTRPPNCSGCRIRAAPRWPRWRSAAAAVSSSSRDPCWIGRAWISVSVA